MGILIIRRLPDVQGRDAGVGITDVKDTMHRSRRGTLQVANFNAFLVEPQQASSSWKSQ